MYISIIKEIAESVIRNVKKLPSPKLSSSEEAKYIEMDERGYALIEDFYPREKCIKLREKIDYFLDSGDVNVWVDDSGSDHRIYFAEDLDEDFKEFYENSLLRRFLKKYTGINDPKGFVLAARIDFQKGNLGSGGGWHRDSPYTHQFKALCYLSEVGSTNGPFQYIPYSHKKDKIISSYYSRVFRPGQYRFNDLEIENYIKSKKTHVVDMTASEGTLVLTDTKGIHRGKPIQAGSRYVVFAYFWERKIPKHFDKFRQRINAV